MYALACSLLLVVSSGCISNFCLNREREPEARARTGLGASVEPLIKPTRGAGVVVGLRVPFELSRRAGADAPTLHDTASSKVIALVTGKSSVQVNKARTEPNKSLRDLRIPAR